MLTRSRSIGLAAVALACAAPPAAANFVVTAADPAGDATDGSPGRDVVRVGLAYDRRTGELRGGVQLAGDPVPTPANLTLFAGRRTATGCNAYPAIGFGTQTDLTGADWVRLPAAGAEPVRGTAVKDFASVAEEYTATAADLRGVRPDCVVAQLNEPGNPAVVYDVAGPYRLRALPELTATFADDFEVVRAGQRKTLVVRLRNEGDAPTGRLRVSVADRKGLEASARRRLRSLAPGGRATVRIQATVSRRAAKQTPVRVTVRGGAAARATAEAELYRSAGTGGGGGGGGDAKLCYAYTWLPPYSTLKPC